MTWNLWSSMLFKRFFVFYYVQKCALLGYCAANSDNFLNLRMEPIRWLETSLRNYYWPRHNTVECSSQLFSGGSLKSRTIHFCCSFLCTLSFSPPHYCSSSHYSTKSTARRLRTADQGRRAWNHSLSGLCPSYVVLKLNTSFGNSNGALTSAWHGLQ